MPPMVASPMVLTFQPDRDEVDRVLALGPPRKAGRRSLGHRLNRVDFFLHDAELWLPVRLAIEGVDLFQCPSHRHPVVETIGTGTPTWLDKGHRPACPWRWLPVVDVATAPLSRIRAARDRGRATYGDHLYGSPVLTFEASGGGALRVTAGDRAAEAPAEALLAAWERFGDEVRAWLVAEVPELTEHRHIGRWLTDGAASVRW
jgi:hypothetical protein